MKTILGYIDGIGFKGFYLIGDLWIFAFIGILFGVFFSLKRKKGMFAAAGIAAGIYLICDLWLLQLCWDLPYGYDWVGFTVVIIAYLIAKLTSAIKSEKPQHADLHLLLRFYSFATLFT